MLPSGLPNAHTCLTQTERNTTAPAKSAVSHPTVHASLVRSLARPVGLRRSVPTFPNYPGLSAPAFPRLSFPFPCSARRYFPCRPLQPDHATPCLFEEFPADTNHVGRYSPPQSQPARACTNLAMSAMSNLVVTRLSILAIAADPSHPLLCAARLVKTRRYCRTNPLPTCANRALPARCTPCLPCPTYSVRCRTRRSSSADHLIINGEIQNVLCLPLHRQSSTPRLSESGRNSA